MLKIKMLQVHLPIFAAVIFVSHFLCTRGKECTVVVPDEEIDFDMVPASWYMILNTKDAMDEAVTCLNIRDIRSAPDGAYFAFETIHAFTNGSIYCNMVPVHWVREGDAFVMDEKFEYLWRREVIKNPGKNPIQDQLKEIHSFYVDAFAIHTDYINYLFGLMCDKDGKKYVWVHSRNPYASGKDMARVKRKLKSLGHGWGEVPLYPAGCRKLRNFDCHIHV